MPLNATSTPFRPDPYPRFNMSIPFLTSETRKAPIVLPLFSRLNSTPHDLERQAAFTPVIDRAWTSAEGGYESSSAVQPQATPSKVGSSRTQPALDSESFYLSRSVANLDDYDEQKHSEASTHSDSDAIRDQLYADRDEGSKRRRPISPSPPDERQKKSATALARRDYSSNSEQPSELESAHSQSAHSNESPLTGSNESAPTGRPYGPFFAHPRTSKIYMEGEFTWYRSEGNKPIDSPPALSHNDRENSFQEADVVVHEVSRGVVQVWCRANDSWMAIKPGYEREIYGKTYIFAFKKHSYKPCWLTPATLARRSWD
ncbi:hypothetical protein HYPSUDRAFT_54629 [Hypholoma sublateritium FD-334 SS-4]|uniref:Uncharacterized protein n=1 Tax=Hypholoma sublateritium (strain FD-334 SS-4) TaxID=945553 RepID=A0A0D2PTH1_HYPSF|nr:hypothetical protein HYPSUDRAFT_54629 [Hypholoma sublateritium FD-334 SS-4]